MIGSITPLPLEDPILEEGLCPQTQWELLSDELTVARKALMPSNKGSGNGLAGPQGMAHWGMGSVTRRRTTLC